MTAFAVSPLLDSNVRYLANYGQTVRHSQCCTRCAFSWERKMVRVAEPSTYLSLPAAAAEMLAPSHSWICLPCVIRRRAGNGAKPVGVARLT